MTDRYERLGAWLGPRLGATGAVTITDLGGPAATGYSAETAIFGASFHTADGPVERRFVLRTEVPEPATYPAQAPGIDIDIDIQHRVMNAVVRCSTVPVPAIVGFEPDTEVLGAPFFVMDFVHGQVPEVMPPYTQSGFFADAKPDRRHQMLTDGMRVLADIHRIDWRAAGLDWLVPAGTAPTTARQIGLWERCGRLALAGRSHEPMERALDLLRRHLPEGSEPTLCWGDARPGNIIWRDWRCATVTDWEAAAIAPPESDLGWWLMFDRTMHEGSDTDRLPGEPTREEQLAIYEDAAGRRVDDIVLHETFAAYRYSVIVVQLANRFVARKMLPEDNTLWRDNPIVQTLEDLLQS